MMAKSTTKVLPREEFKHPRFWRPLRTLKEPGLSVRTYNSLVSFNLLDHKQISNDTDRLVIDIVFLTEAELRRIGGIGNNTMNEIRRVFDHHGVGIGMQLSTGYPDGGYPEFIKNLRLEREQVLSPRILPFEIEAAAAENYLRSRLPLDHIEGPAEIAFLLHTFLTVSDALNRRGITPEILGNLQGPDRAALLQDLSGLKKDVRQPG